MKCIYAITIRFFWKTLFILVRVEAGLYLLAMFRVSLDNGFKKSIIYIMKTIFFVGGTFCNVAKSRK